MRPSLRHYALTYKRHPLRTSDQSAVLIDIHFDTLMLEAYVMIVYCQMLHLVKDVRRNISQSFVIAAQ